MSIKLTRLIFSIICLTTTAEIFGQSKKVSDVDTFINKRIEEIIDKYESDSLIEFFWVKGTKSVQYDPNFSSSGTIVYLVRAFKQDSFDHWYLVYKLGRLEMVMYKRSYRIQDVGGQDTIHREHQKILENLIQKRIIRNRNLGLKAFFPFRRRKLLSHLANLDKPKALYFSIPVY